MSEMTVDKELKFRSARGVVNLVVRGETGDTYIVCTHEELKRAQAERREPRVLGFRKTDVVTG